MVRYGQARALDYAHWRSSHPQLLDVLVAEGAVRNDSCVLELGCGTVNYIAPFAKGRAVPVWACPVRPRQSSTLRLVRHCPKPLEVHNELGPKLFRPPKNHARRFNLRVHYVLLLRVLRTVSISSSNSVFLAAHRHSAATGSCSRFPVAVNLYSVFGGTTG